MIWASSAGPIAITWLPEPSTRGARMKAFLASIAAMVVISLIAAAVLIQFA
jgi:hypothetical protein